MSKLVDMLHSLKVESLTQYPSSNDENIMCKGGSGTSNNSINIY